MNSSTNKITQNQLTAKPVHVHMFRKCGPLPACCYITCMHSKLPAKNAIVSRV